MKPTSPEEHELEKLSSEVSERYRAGPQDEPPAGLDAAVLAAARREAGQSRPRRNWQVPASIAAMLVIGVSLVLMVRENEPPRPSVERPAADEAKLAKPAPPQLAMKAKPKADVDSHREARPSRERSTRPDREPLALEGGVAAQDNAAPAVVAQPVPEPAAPGVAARAKPVEQEQARIAESSDLSTSKKAEAFRKQDGAAPVQPEDWIRSIDDLLRDGRQADAREKLLGFRRQFPHYPLPQRLQALLPPDQR